MGHHCKNGEKQTTYYDSNKKEMVPLCCKFCPLKYTVKSNNHWEYFQYGNTVKVYSYGNTVKVYSYVKCMHMYTVLLHYCVGI